jgi:hypothetical protein
MVGEPKKTVLQGVRGRNIARLHEPQRPGGFRMRGMARAEAPDPQAVAVERRVVRAVATGACRLARSLERYEEF